MYSWFFPKNSLIILRRQYILLTLLLCTAEFVWNAPSYSEETVNTAYITTFYSCVFLKMLLVILRRRNILHTLLLCTAEFLWKCSWLFWGDSTYCSHYFYVQLSFSENVLSYPVETVLLAHNTTTYSWGFLKMFLVIPKRMYLLLTLLLRTVAFSDKVFLFWGDCTYWSHY